MASCSIQIGNPEVLKKIESFLNDSSYRDAIENSSNYNSRLCIERRLRMPFLDSQTGVAQNHSNLFMSSRQRIPGLEVGQIYTYPSKRWRKKRRQYLMNFSQPPRRKEMEGETDLHTISTVENPAASEESKDSVQHVLKEEPPKVPEQWYFDELDMHEMEGFDEPDPDSDFDYEESYSNKRKKKRGSPKGARSVESPIVKKPKGPGRGRKKQNYDALTDADKPFSCERSMTPRRGGRQMPHGGPGPSFAGIHQPMDEPPHLQPMVNVEKPINEPLPPPQVLTLTEEKERAAPSPYCDFCLGDQNENKKTNQSEELVSCSDCGRSGRNKQQAAAAPSRRGRGRRKANFSRV